MSKRNAASGVSDWIRALALAAALSAAGAGAQPDLGQPPYPPAARKLDAETGKTLNAAIAAVQHGKPAEARGALARIDVAHANAYARSRIEQILFNAAYLEGNVDEAAQHLANAADAGGLSAREVSQVRYQAAQLLMSRERWKDGAAALETWFATAVSPSASAYYLLAVAYYQLEDYERALPIAQRAVDLMTEPQESWLSMLVSLRIRNEQFREAVPLLQKLVAIAPGKKSYWLQLSSAYGRLDDPENALGTLQGAYGVGLLTEAAEIRRLAKLLSAQGLPQRAARVLETAIDDGVVSADAALYEQIADHWIDAGDVDNAIARLADGAELSADGNLFVRLGELLLEREDWDGARVAIERGISKGGLEEPALADLWMGVALYRQSRLAEARGWLRQAEQSEKYRVRAGWYLRLLDSDVAASAGARPRERF